MSDTTFAVSPEVSPKQRLEKVDYIGKLRTALRRPIEATWLPKRMLVACDDDHALLTAMRISFYDHMPLRLSPDAIWITIARGFALHVNQNAEALRHRFVCHEGKQKIMVLRPDFALGKDNPWPEVFAEFSEEIAAQTDGLATLVQADFSTTGPGEQVVSHLMAMETFKAYFEYIACMGCGIPSITLSGTVEDWQSLRRKAQQFADYGLKDWIEALDPVLAQFELAKSGKPDIEFWKSMFRYHSGSGPAVMTGWANVLFPYVKTAPEKLCRNPHLKDWKSRLETDDRQHSRERWRNPQGVGLSAIPSSFTSVPLTVISEPQRFETKMRLVGGLMGVTQDDDTLAVEPECGWALIYEEPVDPPAPDFEWPVGRPELKKQTESGN